MASILIATNAGRAHVGPCVPVARELLRRGHAVYWYTGARHAATVAASGARFVEPQAGEFLDMDTVEQDFPELATMKPHQRGPWWVERVFVDPIPGQYQDLRKAATEFGIDVVLADSTMAAASLLHEIDGLLWATLSMAPMAIPDRDVPPFGMGWLPGRSPLHRLRNRLVAGIGDRLVMKAPLARMNATTGSVDQGFDPRLSAPGLSLTLRAEVDTLVLISNCPQVNNPCNGFHPTPIRVVVR